MKSVAQYQLDHLDSAEGSSRGWEQCTFFVGVMATYEATGAPAYLEAVLRWGEGNGWRLGPRMRHADDHCVGQVYLDLYRLFGDEKFLRSTRSAFDRILATPRTGREEWHWSDALFMAPPVLARLASSTGQNRYWKLLSKYYWDASTYLYDNRWNLYYRDENFFNAESPNGKPVFWARGNGWVLAGLARILQVLPADHPQHSRFVDHFRELASSIVKRQRRDGLWRTNLLAPSVFSEPETSSTGLFCYALAWGVNTNYLEEDRYRATAIKAWNGLVRSVDETGRLGWVQPIGIRPGPVSQEDTGVYGAGAFLLAGSEMVEVLANS
jgi:rhamnogalacturonyl hydrolase YesR